MKDKDTLLIEKTYEKSYFKHFVEVFTNDKDEKETKTVDEIIEAPDFKQVGRFTVLAFGNMWKANLTHESLEKNKEYHQILTENPDTVVGLNGKKYPRHIYKDGTLLFTTDIDRNGVFYGSLEDFVSHAFLMREIVIDKNAKRLVKNFQTVSGRRLDVEKNGVVIPKQKDMDYSYVSVWFDGKDEEYIDTLRKFVNFLKIETPIYLEHLASNDLEDYESTGHILLVE
jgi:hypothetical protein